MGVRDGLKFAPRALELRKVLGQASGLEVGIRASTGADMKAVRAAIGAAKQAHVRVSFAAEESPALRSIDPNAASPEWS
jgi:hypothetical protein